MDLQFMKQPPGIRPEKYDNVAKNDGVINEIEISFVTSALG
jgi:hypothetical protein